MTGWQRTTERCGAFWAALLPLTLKVGLEQARAAACALCPDRGCYCVTLTRKSGFGSNLRKSRLFVLSASSGVTGELQTVTAAGEGPGQAGLTPSCRDGEGESSPLQDERPATLKSETKSTMGRRPAPQGASSSWEVSRVSPGAGHGRTQGNRISKLKQVTCCPTPEPLVPPGRSPGNGGVTFRGRGFLLTRRSQPTQTHEG